MAAMSQLEADEAFARQLQAEEGGGGGRFIQLGPLRIQQSPTQQQRQQQGQGQGQRQGQTEGGTAENEPENPTVLNARLNQLSTARATVAAIVVIHLPQVSCTPSVI